MRNSLSASSLSHCACKDLEPFEKRIHDSLTNQHPGQNPSSPEDTLRFVAAIGRLLYPVFNATKDVPVVKGVAKEWPTSLSDVLPSGPDKALNSLLQWQRFVGDLAAIEFFPFIIKMSTSSIYDTVTKLDAMNVLAIEPMRRCLYKTIDALAQERNPLHPSKRDSLTYTNFGRLANGLQDCIKELYKPPLRSNIRMINGQQIRVLQLCSIIVYLLPMMYASSICDGDTISNLAVSIRKKGAILFHVFKMRRAECPDILVHPSIAELHKMIFKNVLDEEAGFKLSILFSEPADLEDSPHEGFVASAMVSSHDLRPCAAPGCDKTFKQAGPKGFQKCARCSTVGYCSRECQIRDWRLAGDDIPHKRVCKLLGRIVAEWKSVGGGWHARKWEGWGGDLESQRDKQNAQIADLAILMKKMRKEGKLSKLEVMSLVRWASRHNREMTGANEDDVQEWHPGYDDYEFMVKKLAQILKAPPPRCIDRTIYEELDRVKELLEKQFFRN
ncbi:hypothetical protein CVT24_002879 [Panaeolus cyanescens]|uniref:MYND-type domain-containing protein n=1 Tax=Panaeolus cyanescens TaxID=181874 RepID=A0A409YRN9_9AGAR|nr:hypothetical protein CVT24_002879 [Panaeolus cyanescens]